MSTHRRIIISGLSIISLIFLSIIVYQLAEVNRILKIQMKQQFHSDAIALVSLFGEDGLNKIQTASQPAQLSAKESFATGLLVQRIIIAYEIRDAFTNDEWQRLVLPDAQETMSSPLLRARWQQIKKYYSIELQSFFDTILYVETK